MPPFGSISLPGIGGWNSKTRPLLSPRSTADLSNVSDGFGVPSIDDPDPFGVRALEQAGLEIKEAGTQSRPTSETFEFKPSPTSPIFRQSFQSIDGVSRHGSVGRESVLRDPRRDSKRSIASVDHGTQTANLPSPPLSPRLEDAKAAHYSPLRKSFDTQPSPHSDSKAPLPSPLRQSFDTHSSFIEDAKPVYESPLRQSFSGQSTNDQHFQDVPSPQSEEEAQDGVANTIPGNLDADVESEDGSVEDDEDDEDDEFFDLVGEPLEIIEGTEPVVAHTIASPTVARAKVVNISRRAPPAIPLRSPLRSRMPDTANIDDAMDHLNVALPDDASSMYSPSPTKSHFEKGEADMSSTLLEQHATPHVQTALDEAEAKEASEETTPVNDQVDQTVALETEAVSNEPETRKEVVRQIPIGQMIRAGLDDSDADNENFDYASVPLPRSPSPATENFTFDHDTQSGPLSIDSILPPPPRSPLRQPSSTTLQKVDPTNETTEEAPIEPSDQVFEPSHHSPGLHSISSEEDRNSRVQSSAPTENIHDTSSMSDYGEYESKHTDTSHSTPSAPSKTLPATSSETNLSEKPT